MGNKEAQKKPWTKPRIERLGEIKNVTGPTGTGPQGTPLRS